MKEMLEPFALSKLSCEERVELIFDTDVFKNDKFEVCPLIKLLSLIHI